jgi:hypothetical protein
VLSEIRILHPLCFVPTARDYIILFFYKGLTPTGLPAAFVSYLRHEIILFMFFYQYLTPTGCLPIPVEILFTRCLCPHKHLVHPTIQWFVRTQTTGGRYYIGDECALLTHPDFASLVDPLFACGGKKVKTSYLVTTLYPIYLSTACPNDKPFYFFTESASADFSCASTTAMVTMFTISRTELPSCKTCTGFFKPNNMGPTASALPISCNNL